MKLKIFTLKFSILTALILILSTLFQRSALATDNVTSPTLTEYISNEILSMDQSLQSTKIEDGLITRPESSEGYFFRRFWLRLRPKVDRDIPFLAGFSVIGELELLWEKQSPAGWQIYKPAQKK